MTEREKARKELALALAAIADNTLTNSTPPMAGILNALEERNELAGLALRDANHWLWEAEVYGRELRQVCRARLAPVMLECLCDQRGLE